MRKKIAFHDKLVFMRRLLSLFVAFIALFLYVAGVQNFFAHRAPETYSGPSRVLYYALRYTSPFHVDAATNCAIAAGSTPATIQTALTAAGSGTCTGTVNANTVQLAAGNYTGYSTTGTIPCNANLLGPPVAYNQTPNQQAHLAGSSSFIGWAYQTQSGCANVQTIQYLEWNGNHPSNGGGFLYVPAGSQKLNVTQNWLHGANAPDNSDHPTGPAQNAQASQIWLDGGKTSTIDNTINITLNYFGTPAFSDCATTMQEDQTEGTAGYCAGVGIHNGVQNVFVNNNIFSYLEQGLKVHEGQGSCQPFIARGNHFQYIDRIPIETQCNLGAQAGFTTLMYLQYNSFFNRYAGANGGTQNYDISAANGCNNAHGTNCITHTDGNVEVINIQNAKVDVGNEIWGQDGTTANYNWIQGWQANGITWAPSGYFTYDSNNFHMQNGGNTNCVTHAGGFWNWEVNPNPPAGIPTCTNNTFSTTNAATVTSMTPTISPASGSFASSQVVTFNCALCVNRDTNTTIWYTTDGSVPSPGNSVSKAAAIGSTITVTSTTTVNYIGMWGGINQPGPSQPLNYPTGWGYLPSPMSTATYTLNSVCPGGVALITAHGAVGDGTTDNTTAINNTASYATTNGCTVGIPAGTFAHSGLLTFNSLKVNGVGSTSILKATAPNTSAVILSGTNPSLQNVVILGTGTTRTSGPNQAGIYINGGTGALVNNNVVNGGSCVGIWNVGGATSTVTNNLVENTLADSITNTNGTTNALDKNNEVFNSGDDGISNNSYNSDATTVTGTIVQQNAIMRNANARALECSGCSNASFLGNYVDNLSGYADLIITAESTNFLTKNVANITVTGNTFVAGGPNQGSLFLWPDGTAKTITAVVANGNQFLNSKLGPIQIVGNGAITASSITNSTAYITPPVAFYNNNITAPGTVAITQSNNVTALPSAYPGAIAPPIAGPIPLFSLPTGNYTLPQSLTLTEVNSPDTITYCTVNIGTCAPTTTYTGALTVSNPSVVCALGINNSVSGTPVPSVTQCATYNGGAPAPTLTGGFQGNTAPAPGNQQTVGAAAIQQTAFGNYSSGTTPLPFSTVTNQDPYGNTVTWSSSAPAILAVSSTGGITCLSAGNAASLAVANPGNIQINQWNWQCIGATPAATPVILPATGTYTGSQSVTMSTTTAGANIFYTTNGTTPTTSSTLYTGAFTVVSTTTVNAIASATGFLNSAVGTSVISISPSTISSVFINRVDGKPINYVAVGGTANFLAVVVYSDGAQLKSNVVGVPNARGDSITAWNTSNAGIATVSNQGVVTGVALGVANPNGANISAVINGSLTGNWVEYVSKSVADQMAGMKFQGGQFANGPFITVSPSLTAISIACAGGATTVAVAATLSCPATCTYSDGVALNCSTTDARGTQAIFNSSNPPAATIGPTGIVTGVSP